MNPTAPAKPAASDSLTSLRGVGPALAGRLARLNIERPADLLFLLPQRYEDRTRLTPLGSLLPGLRTVVEGEIALTEVVYRRRRTLLVRLTDGTGQLTLRFFYFSRAQQHLLARGARLRCYGEARKGSGGIEMIHPEYKLLSEDADAALDDELTPIYPTTEGLQQFRLRGLVNQAIDRYLPDVRDWLPAELIAALGLPSLDDAIRYLHRPPPDADLGALAAGTDPNQRRLALEEMLAHHLSLRQVRERNRMEPGIALPPTGDLRARFMDKLGFTLTGDQQATLNDVETDMAGSHPMMRLIQGDVGCGKTVIAAAAALAAVANGYQVAIMAPTELLSEQHRDNFAKWYTPLGVNVAWLSGSLKKKAREQAYAAIACGDADVIIGTHALFQAGVEYRKLALVIVDEQHRFGVHQRLNLMEKGRGVDFTPHQLVMTATPIPRTLAMTLYADLDTSIIRELPPGRQPIQTVALPAERRAEVIARVRDACLDGHRAYWVCPLVVDSDLIQSQAAESTHAMLKETLPDVTIGLIHGRMNTAEKEQTMQAFAAGRTQVLVATTVIEVGVDVPTATLMIIENSERMGLSQLHQLRGRVGRGHDASSCVLLYKSPLSAIAKKRLNVLRSTTDGFEVAQQDLELRGPGEVLGTRQTGLMQLRVADLIRDADLAPDVHRIAKHLLAEAPAAVEAIIQRWVGASSRYGNV
ncbi:MAG: ATP-dependent DNA helicase RecG [Gammaproteobacteria bacterium]|nr:MAG: ATP-dependent DNA helicase RecG [Gammaproteobacteria bacterium]